MNATNYQFLMRWLYLWLNSWELQWSLSQLIFAKLSFAHHLFCIQATEQWKFIFIYSTGLCVKTLIVQIPMVSDFLKKRLSRFIKIMTYPVRCDLALFLAVHVITVTWQCSFLTCFKGVFCLIYYINILYLRKRPYGVIEYCHNLDHKFKCIYFSSEKRGGGGHLQR